MVAMISFRIMFSSISYDSVPFPPRNAGFSSHCDNR